MGCVSFDCTVQFKVGPGESLPKNIKVGHEVYVPVERVAEGSRAPFAMVRGPVEAVAKRTLTVALPFGIGSVPVASSAVHLEVGVCVIRVGDMDTEDTLLDPVAKSVVQYLRLLVPDDQLKYVALRTTAELYQVYRNVAPAFTHIVFVGHGDGARLVFSCGQKVLGTDLAASLHGVYPKKRKFLSLCCDTGKHAFAKGFSESPCCESIIAPYGKLHGAVASQFLQTLFGYHFLEGRTLKVAFKRTRSTVPGGAAFRIWQNGKFEGYASR